MAEDCGVSWACHAAEGNYPVAFYSQLKGSAGLKHSDAFVRDVAAGATPILSYVWHSAPYDEHPPADVNLGQDEVHELVDAVVSAGAWNRTVFLLTWDDWGSWGDHVAIPNVDHTSDGPSAPTARASRC